MIYKDMKRSVLWLLSVVAMLMIGSCSRRALLSDTELAQVFHDAFLANAYSSKSGLKLDSLRLYDAIFEKYGYTADDVQYTIGNFSKRKSARLGDVVERAIAMLEEEGKRLDLGVAILDTVDKIAERRATYIIHQDPEIEIRSKRDSADLRIVIDQPKSGKYTIKFDYLVDSTDTSKRTYSVKYWLERDTPKSGTRYSTGTSNLVRNKVSSITRTLTIGDEAQRLVVTLAELDTLKTTTHSITYKDLEIKRVPPIDEARERLFKELVNVRIFSDEKLFSDTKGSL